MSIQALQAGDQVIFYKDDYTNNRHRTTDTMSNHLKNGTVLTVLSVSNKRVHCKTPSTLGSACYAIEDLRPALNQDEQLLDNLLKGDVF